MNKILRISLGARLRVIADELAPDITDEDIDSWVDLLEVPIDVALKAERVEGMKMASEAVAPYLEPVNWKSGLKAIKILIEAENDSL